MIPQYDDGKHDGTEVHVHVFVVIRWDYKRLNKKKNWTGFKCFAVNNRMRLLKDTHTHPF